MSIEKRVINILRNQLGMPDGVISINSTKCDLIMDSLDDIECIMALEEEFDLEISDFDAEKLKTVKQTIEYITTAVGA